MGVGLLRFVMDILLFERFVACFVCCLFIVFGLFLLCFDLFVVVD